MQTVAWYYHPIEAEIARGKLESEGLKPYLFSINHAWTNWLICIALGGIQLQVPLSEVKEAREILEIPECIDTSDTCPACGSLDTRLDKEKWKFSFFIVHVFQIPYPFKVKDKKCKTCKHTWEWT